VARVSSSLRYPRHRSTASSQNSSAPMRTVRVSRTCQRSRGPRSHNAHFLGPGKRGTKTGRGPPQPRTEAVIDCLYTLHTPAHC